MIEVASKIYQELIDLSYIDILPHALSQYNIKCFPKLSILEVLTQMRQRLSCLKKIEVNNLSNKIKNHKNSDYYIDEDGIIYVVVKNKVVTTYPNERIFIAKPLFSNKKSGKKWM